MLTIPESFLAADHHGYTPKSWARKQRFHSDARHFLRGLKRPMDPKRWEVE